ncbi:MAG: hypothetical protein ACM31H_00395 [Nitrososphaerales archaeon]
MNIMLLSSLVVSGALLLTLIITIYNYSVPLGEGNDTIMMYYDEPISEQEFDVDENEDEEDDEEEK